MDFLQRGSGGSWSVELQSLTCCQQLYGQHLFHVGHHTVGNRQYSTLQWKHTTVEPHTNESVHISEVYGGTPHCRQLIIDSSYNIATVHHCGTSLLSRHQWNCVHISEVSWFQELNFMQESCWRCLIREGFIFLG